MSVYPVLEQKIKEREINTSVIAFSLKISDDEFKGKLNGTESFYFDEALTIRDYFFPDVTLQELFNRT
ncbi:MAG: hypothetical protein ACI4XP_08420 [Acutalibacteraceae bacterium]